MEIRRPLEWHCKQMDHFVGLNFSANFNFALVGHLLKGNQPSVCLSVLHVLQCDAASGSGSGLWFTSLVSRLQTPVSHHRGQNREDPAHAAVPHQQTPEMRQV